MHILVCGGAGYVGAHAALAATRAGHDITVLDNFSTGHRPAVRWGRLVEADILKPETLDAAFERPVDAVMHFCARSLVGESVQEPYAYYENNVMGTLNLLQAMRQHDVGKLVFSSTAAIFGNPVSALIDEDHPKAPINPYGASKLMVERILADAASAYGLRSTCLRYFNAAGAAPEEGIGESHQPETHLIPNVLRAALGTGPELRIFGDDYDTVDGTCVRDYVHVLDLADAHLRALGLMSDVDGAHAFNLGNGQGFSVRQVLEAGRQVSGREIPHVQAARRDGDPAVLVASSSKARSVLGWNPVHTQLESIIDSAWRWHQAQAY
ncbi:UDP-galactose 4-epimerase [Pseudoxanthomonas sp. GM95]|uniref:UDP-glucose 4-epimerase GalE n=1 Tax=Pseudoxanthomonas sp. GM95 TaxID=1881043 RepID=UPI0008C7489A|nr:UDP-glucose 4-epimerase GalE [Pseudoxanthomonas sp. GM95]SEM45453.1 UDP-galactose 4-epimerase [Pseudoxanthomonas sp. GM95]